MYACIGGYLCLAITLCNLRSHGSKQNGITSADWHKQRQDVLPKTNTKDYMQSIYFRRTLALLVLAVSFLIISQNASCGTSFYGVQRFTDTGKKDNNGVAIVRWDQGDLHINQGFIAQTTDEYSASQFRIDSDTLSDINDKFVKKLSTWTLDNTLPGYLDAFQRSNSTFSIEGVPHVIISLKGTSNQPGNSCSSSVTAITEGIPVVTLSTPQPNASESGPINGRFQIDLDAPRAKRITVSYTISGSAIHGKDYKTIKKSVVIPAGTTSGYVDISPINDRKKETTETVTMNINPASTYTLSTANVASLNIFDND